MNIKLDIDCTPQEARAFFGLPDLEPVHRAYVERMQQFVTEGLSPADFEKILRGWMPYVEGGMDAWMKGFQQMTGAATKND